MRLLYVAMRHDYGKPEQGDSFEHLNFFDTLVSLASQTTYFDFPAVRRDLGRAGMNRRLVEIARSEKPDLMFTVLTGDEFSPRTLQQVRDTGCITLNWFCDDHWRFQRFTRKYAPCFDHVVTTARSALPRYAEAGITNVIESQWACNPRRYPRLNLPPVCDVSFVGMAHGDRKRLVGDLRKAGLNVLAFGRGWDRGRLTHGQMVRLFNQSRINLNFAAASASGQVSALERVIDRTVRQPMLQWPMLWRLAPGPIDAGPRPRQIKARAFEVPACGGFLLTEEAENIGDYFVPGREIATFRRTGEIVDRVRYHLAHEDERRAMADAAHRRVVREHTYAQRLREVMRQVGLSTDVSARREAA